MPGREPDARRAVDAPRVAEHLQQPLHVLRGQIGPPRRERDVRQEAQRVGIVAEVAEVGLRRRHRARHVVARLQRLHAGRERVAARRARGGARLHREPRVGGLAIVLAAEPRGRQFGQPRIGVRRVAPGQQRVVAARQRVVAEPARLARQRRQRLDVPRLVDRALQQRVEFADARGARRIARLQAV